MAEILTRLMKQEQFKPFLNNEPENDSGVSLQTIMKNFTNRKYKNFKHFYKDMEQLYLPAGRRTVSDCETLKSEFEKHVQRLFDSFSKKTKGKIIKLMKFEQGKMKVQQSQSQSQTTQEESSGCVSQFQINFMKERLKNLNMIQMGKVISQMK